MRLLIIRHADPDYSLDSLTPLGFKQATALGKYLKNIKIDKAFVSPLGRALKTAELGLKEKNMKATILPWLREFDASIDNPNGKHYCWDWPIDIWSKDPSFYSIDTWTNNPIMKESSDLKELLKERIDGLDSLLKEFGYVRDIRNYKVIKQSHDTVALFCHFGVGCVLLSHLINCSPMVLWHGFIATPSSITVINTEERKNGLASWRISRFGDISHLEKENIEESFAGRFCECFDDITRHD
ncbi:MAG TPA: histidine phosphatase family protein [Firmicutes bacterium]|nr:histidine phosphatase family protein [Bacillota bacterium]HBM70337.1 histidine phosphatase family protein [Bacillota bacterium]HBX25000.1 histidine phosphatase family protein [Bacillota bacterium]